MLFNVSFSRKDSSLFYEYMNNLRPDSYNKKDAIMIMEEI